VLDLDWERIGLVYMGLHVFGWVYNWFVAWSARRLGPNHAWVADEVVVGSLVVLLLLIPLIGVVAVTVALGGFAAAGLPMWYGERARFAARARAQDREIEQQVNDLLDQIDNGDSKAATRRSRQ
jgi:hypothetical protein